MLVSRALLSAIALIGCASCFPFRYIRIETVYLNFRCLRTLQNIGSEKSPVLLIHGLYESLSNWDSISEDIAYRTGREVCAVDLRNHGDSPWSERLEIEVLTEDITNFLKKKRFFKTEKVNIIGHSIGGKIGVHYSLKNPDKVDSLVVEDMRANGITENALRAVMQFARLLEQAIDSLPEGLNEQEAKQSLGDFINRRLRESGSQELNDKMIQAFQIRLVNNEWQWKINLDVAYRYLQKPEVFLTESKGLYKGPTLFIYGTQSPFDVEDDEENIKKLFPNAELIPVEGAGHFIHDEFQEFEEEVVKLLNSL